MNYDIILSKGWHSLEFYGDEQFRWSEPISEIIFASNFFEFLEIKVFNLDESAKKINIISKNKIENFILNSGFNTIKIDILNLEKIEFECDIFETKNGDSRPLSFMFFGFTLINSNTSLEVPIQNINHLDELMQDFDPKIYKLFNQDLFLIDDDAATNHYVYFGIKEKRKYKCDFLHKETVQLDTDCIKNRPVFINHDVSLTGAPIFLNDFASFLRDKINIDPVMIDPYPNKIFKSYKLTRIYHFNDQIGLKNILNNIDPIFIYSNSVNLFYKNSDLFKEFFDKTIFHFHETLECVDIDNLKKIKDQKIYTVADKIKKEFEDAGCIDVNVFPPFISENKCQKIKKSSENVEVFNDFRNIDKNKVIVGMSGQICKRKNFKLFYKTAERNPNKEFVWVGGEWCDTKIYGENFQLDNFFHVPYKNNPYPYFHMFDCFFLTSLVDPCPIVVLENLLLNKKVIVLKNNILYEHKNLNNYFVVDNKDKEEDAIINEVTKILDGLQKKNFDKSGEHYIRCEFSKPKFIFSINDKNLKKIIGE